MHPKKIMPIVIALLLTCAITGVGIAVVSQAGNDAFLGTIPEMELYATIDDESVPFGTTKAQAELIGPVAGQDLATTAVIVYDGAISVRYYNASSNTFKVKISANGRTSSCTYKPDNSTLRIPLMYGEGEYMIMIMEMLGTEARTVVSQRVQCGGTVTQASAGTAQTGTSSGKWTIDTTDPYLTAVSDINWSDDLSSVKKARELCDTLTGEKEKAKAVYNFLVARLSYDYSKVGKLPSGYTPTMDTTYSTSKGICYDFASLYAGMLRSVGVKTKMVTGYNSMIDGYHAWNDVYYDGAWHRVDLTIDSQLRESKVAYGFESPQGTVTVSKSY